MKFEDENISLKDDILSISNNNNNILSIQTHKKLKNNNMYFETRIHAN